MNRVSPELGARMIALVRDLAETPIGKQMPNGSHAKAKAIVAELPAPVDRDRELVRRILARYHQTRMADVDPIDFILASPEVKAALARQESPQ